MTTIENITERFAGLSDEDAREFAQDVDLCAVAWAGHDRQDVSYRWDDTKPVEVLSYRLAKLWPRLPAEWQAKMYNRLECYDFDYQSDLAAFESSVWHLAIVDKADKGVWVKDSLVDLGFACAFLQGLGLEDDEEIARIVLEKYPPGAKIESAYTMPAERTAVEDQEETNEVEPATERQKWDVCVVNEQGERTRINNEPYSAEQAGQVLFTLDAFPIKHVIVSPASSFDQASEEATEEDTEGVTLGEKCTIDRRVKVVELQTEIHGQLLETVGDTLKNLVGTIAAVKALIELRQAEHDKRLKKRLDTLEERV